MSELLESLPERLKYQRWKSALSLRQLEKASGVSRNTISLIESGRTPDPGVGTVERIAEALGVKPGWLAFGKGK